MKPATTTAFPQRGAATKDEWLTPPSIIKALGPFDLDPCALVNRPWPTAATHLTEADNGLTAPWAGYVWLNPPYSQLRKWLARAAAHGNAMALTFARTDTRAFHASVLPVAASLFFFAGRLRFHHVDGTESDRATAPSVLIAYGDHAHNKLQASSSSGQLGQGSFLSIARTGSIFQ